MALTGFDPGVVNSSINQVNAAYRDLMQALVTSTQSKFIDPMGNQWACKEAQTWFQSFTEVINELANGCTQTFESVVNTMNEAGQAWAQTTGGTEYSSISFNPAMIKCNADSIKENIGGVRGVDKENANQTVSSLSAVTQSCNSALSSAKSAVSSCGFMGGNQAESLISALNQIGQNISEAVGETSSAAKTAISNTVTAYGDQATNIANAFNGG